VGFDSYATDLVAGDGNGTWDVFVRDLVAGITVRASVDSSGGDPNGSSDWPAFSADGHVVAFESTASDLVAGDQNGLQDVFVRDLITGTTVRASVDTGGGDPNGDSYAPTTLSADGRYVAFSSYASDLVAGDGNGTYDVFVRDLVAGTTVRASVASGGGDTNGSSYYSSISADGRYVAFWTYAYNLGYFDNNEAPDIYVRDLVTETTARASVDSSGGDPAGDSGDFGVAISAEGRYVAFDSSAYDLVAGDGNGLRDMFVRDLVAGITIRVSLDAAGGDPDGESRYSSMSANGRYVVFDSVASDLLFRRGDRRWDVFNTRS
jgi:Tol biopolymer transport system component